MNMNRAIWLDQSKQKWAGFCLGGGSWRSVCCLSLGLAIDMLWAFWFSSALLILFLTAMGLDDIYMKAIRILGSKASVGRSWAWKMRSKAMDALEWSIESLGWLSLAWLSSRLIGAVGLALDRMESHSGAKRADELDAWVWRMGFNPLVAWRMGVSELPSPWWLSESEVNFSSAPGRLARWAPRRCGWGAALQWEAWPVQKASVKMLSGSWAKSEEARDWLRMGDAQEERRILEQIKSPGSIQTEQRSRRL